MAALNCTIIDCCNAWRFKIVWKQQQLLHTGSPRHASGYCSLFFLSDTIFWYSSDSNHCIVATLEDIMFINLIYYIMLIQLKPLIIGLTMFWKTWPGIVSIWWRFASLSFSISSSKCSGLLEGIYFDEQPLRPSFRPFPAICKDCHAVATSTSNYCCTSSTPSTTTNQTTNWQ